MSKVLVLNFDYTPLNVTSLQRGFVLVDKGKAEIVKADETPIITSYKNYVRPIIIRLLKFINFRNRGFRVNRNRIFRRDNHECNLKKGDKTPEEARMQLRVKPYDPGYIAESSVIMEAWESLQNSFFS
jgi:hypothetical protein